MGDAVILGYGAVPVGIYQRTKDGRDTPLEHELAVRVVLEAMRMAGLHKDDLTRLSRFLHRLVRLSSLQWHSHLVTSTDRCQPRQNQ